MRKIDEDSTVKSNDSEGIFQEIVENLTDVVIKLQINGIILYISPQVEKIFGYPPHEVLNQKVDAFLHPDDLLLVIERVRKVIQEGGIDITNEFRVRHKNGQYRTVVGHGKIIRTGKIPQLISVITDITEMKEIQEMLLESEERYKLIAENMEDMVSVFDRNLRLLYINEGQQKISGFTKEEIMNKSGLDFIHPEDLARILHLFKEALKTGTGLAEYRIRRKDNTYTWLETRGQGVIDRHGEKNLVITSRQIDTRKKLEQKLKESEERYRLISENANDLIIIENLNLEPDYINRQPLKDLLGYATEDVIGKNSLSYIHPDDRMYAITAFQQAIDKGEGSAEFRIRHREGHYLWFEAKGRTFLNERGEKKLIILSRDITQRKQATAQLTESEARYRLITENVKDLITVIDQNMRIKYVNYQTHQDRLGPLMENAVLNPTIDQIHPEDRIKLVQLAEACFKTNEVKTATFRIRGVHGQYLWFETTGNTYRDEKGDKKLIAISRDITERQHLLTEIRRQNEELQKIDQLKEELYADIAHELRTPLTIIKGYAELLLLSPNINDSQITDIRTILRHEERLERLINELLEYSRIKASSIKFTTSLFRLADLMDSLLVDLASLMEAKQLLITKNFDPDAELATDKDQISKVIKNILINAIKFSFPGGTITITSQINGSTWIFSIQDQGVGISQEDIPKLFIRFSKLKSSQDQNVEGLGIGLALSKRIIEAFGGRIWAESRGPGKGSTFTFQITLNIS